MTELAPSPGLTPGSADVSDASARAFADPNDLGVARAAALFEHMQPEKAAEMLHPVLAGRPDSAPGWILMARIRLAVTRFLARACVERARGPRDEVRRHRLRLAQAFVLGALIELMGAEMRQRVDERELAASLRALVARPCVALHGADGAMSGA